MILSIFLYAYKGIRKSIWDGSFNGRIRTLIFIAFLVTRWKPLGRRGGNSSDESVRECRFDSCPIHPHRRIKI